MGIFVLRAEVLVSVCVLVLSPLSVGFLFSHARCFEVFAVFWILDSELSKDSQVASRHFKGCRMM